MLFDGKELGTPVQNERLCDVAPDVYLPEIYSEVEWCACSRANLLWLMDLPGKHLAVDLSRGASTLDDVSRSQFETVRYFDLTASGALPLPISSAVADCVFLHRAWLDTPTATRSALLAECARILRPGGHLLLSVDHSLSLGRSSIAQWLPRAALAAPVAFFRRWKGRLSRKPDVPWPLNGLTRELHCIGFTEVRRYFVLPTIDAPQQLVPADSTALLMHESQQGKTRLRGTLRRMLFGAGLEAVLFPGFLLIAVR